LLLVHVLLFSLTSTRPVCFFGCHSTLIWNVSCISI
jgi:hypothetical protein